MLMTVQEWLDALVDFVVSDDEDYEPFESAYDEEAAAAALDALLAEGEAARGVKAADETFRA